MMHSTFILSLLVSTATVGFALPASKPASSTATITSTPCSTAIATSISLAVDNDQPAPYLSIHIPLSELFDPANAPAFTNTPGTPLPMYPSTTPCSSKSQPTQSSLPPPAATFSVIFSTTIPTELPAATPATSSVPPPAIYSDFFSATIPSELLTRTPAPSVAPSSTTSCTKSKPASSIATAPTQTPAGSEQQPTPSSSKAPQPNPTKPATTSGRPANPPAYGWGRPRPSGRFPHFPGYKPSNAYGHPRPAAPKVSTKPKESHLAAAAKKASSTPCTLETRVRPTATPSVGAQ